VACHLVQFGAISFSYLAYYFYAIFIFLKQKGHYFYHYFINCFWNLSYE